MRSCVGVSQAVRTFPGQAWFSWRGEGGFSGPGTKHQVEVRFEPDDQSSNPDAKSGNPDAKSGKADAKSGKPDANSGNPGFPSGFPDFAPGAPDCGSGFRELASGSDSDSNLILINFWA